MSDYEVLREWMKLWDDGIIRMHALTDDEQHRCSHVVRKARQALRRESAKGRIYGKRREGMSASELKYPGLAE